MKNGLIVVDAKAPVPAPIAAAGAAARKRFVEFFTANIRNRNTRLAYARAVSDFFAWCEQAGLTTLELLQPVHVAAYIEQLSQTRSAPSVKQHLAAIRMLFNDVIEQIGDPEIRSAIEKRKDQAIRGLAEQQFMPVVRNIPRAAFSGELQALAGGQTLALPPPGATS